MKKSLSLIALTTLVLGKVYGQATCPTNNTCATAYTLTPSSSCVTSTFNIAGCTDENTTGDCTNGAAADNTIWFKFTAIATTATVTAVGNAGTDIVLGVLSTCGTTTVPSGGACVDASSDAGTETRNLTGLTIGATYYIMIHEYNADASGGGTICVQQAVPPANDNCSGAVVLTSGTTCTTTAGTTAGATESQVACLGNADDDVWYTFTASQTVHNITVANTGGGNNIVTEAFTGGCASLTQFAGSCSDANAGQSLLGLTIGTQYFFRIHTNGNSNDTQFNICVTHVVPPVNDNCSDAVTLTSNTTCTTTAGTTANATQSQLGCSGTADDDVWYTFTAVSTSHNITVTNTGGSTSIVTQVFTGTCGSLTQFGGACSTNATGQSLVGLTIGTQYFVRIHTSGSGTNTQFNICVTHSAPPANDLCSGAITLTPSTSNTCTTTSGTTAGANDNNETGECTSGTENAVWYKFVATAANHTITVDGAAGFDAVVQVQTGCGGAVPTGGTCVSVTADGGVETLTLTGLTVGTTYYVQVHDFNGDIAPASTFTICVTTPPTTGSASCATLNRLCTNIGQTLTFGATIGADDASVTNPGNDYSCLITTPRPTWFYIQMQTGGSLDITLQGYNTANSVVDNDFALWGPYANLAAAQAACNAYPLPIDCSYAAGTGAEAINIPTTATAGQVYVLVVTAYSSSSDHFTLVQTGGTGSTECAGVVGACDISAVSATPGACATGLYNLTGSATFVNAPATGNLVIKVDGVTQQTIAAPFTSPTAYSVTGLTADGASHIVQAQFSASSTCSQTQTYTSPAACSSCGAGSMILTITPN